MGVRGLASFMASWKSGLRKERAYSRKDRDLFVAVGRVAESVGVTAYSVDKPFWLVGSGHFYMDGLRLPNHRDEFIAVARERLG